MSSPQPTYEPRFLPPGFRCHAEAVRPDAMHVAVSGELDLATAPALCRVLAEVPRGCRVVTLDLSELTFLDCSGVHVVVDASARLAEAGCRLVLVRESDPVRRIFELTDTEGLLESVAPVEGYGVAV